jgi:SAM-dependent methyltransferase
METFYQKEYAFIYSNHWWYQARERCILSVVQDLYKNKPLKILEIGCGPGQLLEKLREFGEVEGIEPAESVFQYDREISPMVRRISFPHESRGLPPGHYDLILLLDVLEHLQDDNAAILEVKRLLKQRGSVIITAPAFMSLWGPHDAINQHYRRYTLKEMVDIISASGFHKIWGSYYFGWCFLPVWIIRHIRRITRKEKPAHDFKIPVSLLNTLLLKISCLEFRIVRRWGIPFGSSLFLIAQKI